MKSFNVGVNGMGRIGRSLIRESIQRASEGEDLGFKITSVNNPGDIETYMHLLKYDSVHGKLDKEITLGPDKKSFSVAGQEIQFYTQKNPSDIPWGEKNVKIVLDSTGVFKDKKGLSQHMHSGVEKVILCAPGKDVDGTFVYGINHETFDPAKHSIISNASCTTNCLAPVAKVLNDNYGIESGFMTTVHAYTSDQNLLDNSHGDLRRARAAAVSMIPTSTGAAKATSLVIPELKGKLDGHAIRVPTADVSLVDLCVNLKKEVSADDVNKLMKRESEGSLKGVLAYTDEPLVAIDFTGRRESSIFDSLVTQTMGKTLKLVSWYDNEIGFSNRVLDLASYVGRKTWL